MKTPFILTVKNQKSFVLLVNIENIEKENERAAVLDELPKGISRSDVLTVTCFCCACQSAFMMELSMAFGPVYELLSEYDPQLVYDFASTQEESYSVLSKSWKMQKHLIEALVSMKTYLSCYKKAAEEMGVQTK